MADLEKQNSDSASMASTMTHPINTDTGTDTDTDTDTDKGVETTASLPEALADQHDLESTFSRTLSRLRTPDGAHPPGPPPDGGLRAWLTVLLCHLVIFNTWGFINSFGLFQTYYTTVLHLGTPAQVAWIGSMQIFILFALGTFSGRATDAGFFKLTLVVGSVVQLLGMFLTSLCRRYWQVFLAQGVLVGVGNGLVFVPSVAVTSTYFARNRSVALGLAACGSATGGLVFPALAEHLLPTVGLAWTVRVMGFVMAVVMVVCVTFMQPRLPPRKTGPIVEWRAFGELPFLLFCIGTFFLFWGVYVGFYYVGSFGRDVLGTSQTTSINLLLTMNGIGLPGRVIPNYLADRKCGPLNALLPFAVIAGIMLFAWMAVKSVAGLWVFAAVYGAFAAGIQSLFPAVLTSLTTDPHKVGVRTGMGFGVVGFAVLTGPPLAGALIQTGQGSYILAQAFAGSVMFAGFITLVFARWAKVGWKLTVKV